MVLRLGSGYLPRGSKSLFDGMPQDMEFPWETWTRKRPPRDPVWTADYIRIGPASRDANNNWARKPSPNTTTFTAFAVRMSQAGDAKLLQIAAYDRNGNIMKVPFHVSFYTVSGIAVTAMPALTKEQATKHPPYKKGQRYPFFDGAFEQVNAIGTDPIRLDEQPACCRSAGGLGQLLREGRVLAWLLDGHRGAANRAAVPDQPRSDVEPRR